MSDALIAKENRDKLVEKAIGLVSDHYDAFKKEIFKLSEMGSGETVITHVEVDKFTRQVPLVTLGDGYKSALQTLFETQGFIVESDTSSLTIRW